MRSLVELMMQAAMETDVNNSDIVALMAEQHSIRKADAKVIIETVFAALSDAAARDEEVSIDGFGKFKVKESGPREGRNPSTGKTIQIPASKRLGFVAVKALKDRLKG